VTDDCEITAHLVENILVNVKILRDHYSSCLDESDFEKLVEDVDFQWFLDEIDEFEK